MNFLFFTIIALVIGIIADLISKNGFVAIVCKFRFIGSPIPLATDQCFRL